MAKAPRPRNYEFLHKFSYYIPNVADMFILLAFLLLGGLLGNLVVLPMVALMGQDAGMQYGMLVSYPLMFIPAMIYASVKSRGNSFTKDGLLLDSNKHFKPHGGALCALLVVLATLAAAFCSDAILASMPDMPPALEELLKGLTSGDDFFVNFLMVSIFAPFFEEWLCRGMILRGLLGTKVKPVWAIVISAVFFAVIHLNPWQAVPAFLLGCLFGYVYYKTGSVMGLAVGAHYSCPVDREDHRKIHETHVHYQLIVRALSRIPQERPQGNMDPVKPLFEE